MKLKVLFLSGLMFCNIILAFAQAKNADIEKKIDALLSKMTLDEKIGQMNQVAGVRNLETAKNQVKSGSIGSYLNAGSVADINVLQKVAMEESRLGIPLIIGRDVIHGFKTIFPIPLGQAASFNPQVAENGARVAAIEASSVGIRWTFAPMIDISRDPRWGRIAESCGEDPYLTSIMGVAMVKGFQGASLNDPTSIAACAKHYVAYGAAEGGRDYNSTHISERNLRNVYLPPFEAAAKAGAATFMSSFNDNDGVPSTGNKFILTDVLRGEWGFDGFVVSDWNSINEMVQHGFAENNEDAARIAANAGLDMDMVSNAYSRSLKKLVEENKVSIAVIDQYVRNILRIKFRLGLFENPYVKENAPSVFYAKDHLNKAKEAAEQSVILLKNDNQTLPLKDNVKTIAIIGPMADAPHDQLGTWVLDGEKEHSVTPLNAIKEMYGSKVKIIYEQGLRNSRDKSTAGFAKAVEAARSADIVLAFMGEESVLSGEAHSMANIALQGAQPALISALAETGKPVITIIMAGRQLIIANEVEKSAAVLYSFHPGTMGGTALADIIFGKTNPSGKTPVTFTKMIGQIPMYHAHNNTGRPSNARQKPLDEIPVEQSSVGGAASSYLDAVNIPYFPFGFGLSYTTFEYESISISKESFNANETIKVSFDLKNTGNYAGTEVAQLYVRDLVGSVTRPVRELKRFDRITLKPGETKKVEFTLPVEELAFWNIDMKKVVEPGKFKLWVGGNSEATLEADFSVIE